MKSHHYFVRLWYMLVEKQLLHIQQWCCGVGIQTALKLHYDFTLAILYGQKFVRT